MTLVSKVPISRESGMVVSISASPVTNLLLFNTVLLDFSLTVKAAPHECVIRTCQP